MPRDTGPAGLGWPRASPGADVPLGEVHLWRWVVPSVLGPGAAAWLSATEQARAARFRREAPRREFVAARIGLRWLLGALLGLAPAAVPLVIAPGGKPALPPSPPGSPPPPEFSVTHAGGVVVVAIAVDRPVGIDREPSRTVPELPALITAHTTLAERAAILALPAAEQSAAFFALWTAKEAYLKGIGTGLHTPMRAVSLGPGWLPTHRPGETVPGRMERFTVEPEVPPPGPVWTGRWLTDAPGATIAVVAPGPDWTLHPWTLPDDCLGDP